MESQLTQIDIDNMFTLNDNRGSSIACTNGNLVARFASEDREPRNIGRVQYIKYSGIENPLLIYSCDEKVDNVHAKLKAWGLYSEIILKVEGVVIYVNDDKFAIKTETAKQVGSYLPHAKEGLDKKFYIPIEHWKITKNKS